VLHPQQHCWQQQQQQMGQAFAWMPASLYSQGSGDTADLSGLIEISLNAVSCEDLSDSFDGLADAELEAMIEHELRAAAALPIEMAAAGGYTASMTQQMQMLPMGTAAAAVALPTGAWAAPAAPAPAAAMGALNVRAVADAADAAAQYVRLQSLRAEYAELSVALRQLQQAAGMLRQADSGHATMGYF
jgi:hypothetical protein